MSALQIADLQVSYGQQRVLRGLSLQVELGCWFCLLGPNGAGKSTLIHSVSGRIRVPPGVIRICGHELQADAQAAKSKLGVACAPEQLPGLLTGWQCLEIYASVKGLAHIDPAVLALAEALQVVSYLAAAVDTYSLGTRQKVCVLLALLGDPGLIVLDEAFNGLDPRSARVLKQHLRERLAAGRCSILLATHSLDIVEHHGDAAALLLEGRIAQTWTAAELGNLRTRGGDALEQELSLACGVLTP